MQLLTVALNVAWASRRYAGEVLVELRPSGDNPQLRRAVLRALSRLAASIDHPTSSRIATRFASHSPYIILHLPHHSAVYQAALITPISDRNRSRLIRLRLTSHDDHRDA